MQTPDNGSIHFADASNSFESAIPFPEHTTIYPGHTVGSSQNLDPFSTDTQHATNPADPHEYFWPENNFMLDDEELRQSSLDWNAAETFAEVEQVHGNLYQEESPAGPAGSSWSNVLPVAWNPFDQNSVRESASMQDVPTNTMNRDAMGSTAAQSRQEEYHGSRFGQRSEPQRHEDRHSDPLICHLSSCNQKSFADRGSLQRHNREVHKSARYFCPVPNCRRNKRGFGRKYNLVGHNKRAHLGAASNPVNPVSEDAREKSLGHDDQTRLSESNDGVEELLVDEGGADVESPEDTASLLASSSAEELKRKLRKLRAMKNEHDSVGEELSREIQIVERLLLDAVCNEG